MDTAAFIQRIREANGDTYDYSKVVYVNLKTKIIIGCPLHGDVTVGASHHLYRRQGCGKCAGRLSNTAEFIINAKEVHGDTYDYSKTVFKNSSTPIIITCKLHGDFEKPTSFHLAGSGCPKCGRLRGAEKRKTGTEAFIKKAKEVHGEDKYDYSKVEYGNSKTLKVTITCPTHGDFEQAPGCHLSGQGCSKCVGCYKLNTGDFIERAKTVHGNDRYNYDKVVYVRSHEDVILTCPKHGDFGQTPNAHVHGQGCPKCGKAASADKRRSNTEEFIEKSKQVHGDDTYDYSKVDYVRALSKVTIVCKRHGDFDKTPADHLFGYGCPRCSNMGYSKIAISWLEFLQSRTACHIQHALTEDNEHKIAGTNFRADGYCRDTNTVYEFHGDYFHGNPKVFFPAFMNTTCGKTMGELYERTQKKKATIKALGHNYVEMWEHDWRKAIRGVVVLQRLWRSILHKREYPYQCMACKYECKYKCEWTKHVATKKHLNQPRKKPDRKCPHCEHTSKTVGNLKVHILNAHSSKDVRKQKFAHYCEACDYGTMSSTNYAAHTKAKTHERRINNANANIADPLANSLKEGLALADNPA